jgi:glycosyltransferase involved in cell wall biosynthesis
MDAITICAANYLPLANVLGNSFIRNNPKSTFSILVIDAKKIDFAKNLAFNYLTPDELDISSQTFENMTFYYNVTELATALKPTAIKTLFKKGSEKVIYLDPDIEVFNEFVELDEALDKNPIVLTPHTLKPIPQDGLRPSDVEIMSSGTFNLGFIGLSKSNTVDDLLNWWEKRLKFDSISDPQENLFTDQRWIDLVPSYFPIHVLKDPGYNAAYWNLHERDLKLEDKSVRVGGSVLKFFHFSGYSPNKPWILSKYVSNNPRVVISNNSVLENLCSSYGQKVVDEGWTLSSSLKYGYENFENGNFIPAGIRRLYRLDCIAAERRGEVFSPPSNWQKWATDRSLDSGNLSRILYTIWKSRPDLQRRFPDATGREAADLVAWAKRHGVKERIIDENSLTIGELAKDAYPNKFSRNKGINIAGHLSGELGIGQSARLILASAKATRFPVTALNSHRLQSRQNEVFDDNDSKELYPLTISVINADQFKVWMGDYGKPRANKSTVIGVWAWEIEDFPEYMQKSFQYVDEIWAVSEFTKAAFKPHTRKPIYVLPTPILKPASIEKLNRKSINLPESAIYNLFIFDYLSVFNRKNPLGVAMAHMGAFPNQNGPKLVIKSSNGDKDAENREKLRYFVKDRADIILIEDYLSREQLTALINECAVYVSLHRSEGYGLTLAEAMSLGKPVIATAYSGNLDFMDSSNSCLVPYSLVEIGDGSTPYSSNSQWAEPNLEEASKFMSQLATHPELAYSIGVKAQSDVLDKFTIERCRDFIENRAYYHFSLVGRSKRNLIISVKQVRKLLRAIIVKWKNLQES